MCQILPSFDWRVFMVRLLLYFYSKIFMCVFCFIHYSLLFCWYFWYDFKCAKRLWKQLQRKAIQWLVCVVFILLRIFFVIVGRFRFVLLYYHITWMLNFGIFNSTPPQQRTITTKNANARINYVPSFSFIAIFHIIYDKRV